MNIYKAVPKDKAKNVVIFFKAENGTEARHKVINNLDLSIYTKFELLKTNQLKETTR